MKRRLVSAWAYSPCTIVEFHCFAEPVYISLSCSVFLQCLLFPPEASSRIYLLKKVEIACFPGLSAHGLNLHPGGQIAAEIQLDFRQVSNLACHLHSYHYTEWHLRRKIVPLVVIFVL